MAFTHTFIGVVLCHILIGRCSGALWGCGTDVWKHIMGSGVGGWGISPAEPRPAADCLQRPLVPRFRFQPQLTPGVDMTSNVKSWLPMFWHVLYPLVLRPPAEPEPGIYDGCSCC